MTSKKELYKKTIHSLLYNNQQLAESNHKQSKAFENLVVTCNTMALEINKHRNKINQQKNKIDKLKRRQE